MFFMANETILTMDTSAIKYGIGATHEVGDDLVALSAKRTMLVTDPNLSGSIGVETARAALIEAGIEVVFYDRVRVEPTDDSFKAAIEFAVAENVDSFVAVGGGSVMDTAKAANLYSTFPDEFLAYVNAPIGQAKPVPGRLKPLIAIPTTSGTGSEVSHAAVLTDTQAEVKVSCLSNHLRPLIALVDPALTYQCPAKVMAHSGIDALTHAIEACTNVDYDQLETPGGQFAAYYGRFPIGDCLGERAIRLIGHHLEPAVRVPQSRAARDQMSLAATLAGLAFSNCGVGIVHALEYPIGAAVHCSHGEGNGCLLPYVMRFILPVRTRVLADIARALGCAEQGDDRSMAEAAIDRVIQLRQSIGIAHRLRDLGVTEDQLPEFARKSWRIQRLLWLCARRPTEQDMLDILRAAF